MRVVELSNHPGDMIDEASRRRAAAEKHVLSVYEDEFHDKQRHDKRRRAGRHPPR